MRQTVQRAVLRIGQPVDTTNGQSQWNPRMRTAVELRIAIDTTGEHIELTETEEHP